MYTSFGSWMIFPFLFYLVIVVFLVWLGYRFVKAHESMAESLENIEKKLSQMSFDE
jgi:uncharacterized membrane protein